MVTVTSISGGKTSAYMAKHYKTDKNIFALVRIEADYCKPKDESIIKYASDKIGIDFIATAESDKTLYVVRDLEQLLGSEIIWVTGETFEIVISKHKALPNMMWRFCTIEMKIKPIFDWWYNNYYPDKVSMNIGFRYDEKERAFDSKTGLKKEERPFKHIIGKHENGNNKWQETQWRNESHPLIVDRITHLNVNSWAKQTGLIFPGDSNCVGCFWKQSQQLRKNWDNEPQKMRWFSEMETKIKRRFKKEMTYEQIKSIGLQQDFVFGGGSGCQAGYCTD